MLRYRGRYRDIGALEKNVNSFLNERNGEGLSENIDA
jgi:hypothetical protein